MNWRFRLRLHRCRSTKVIVGERDGGAGIKRAVRRAKKWKDRPPVVCKESDEKTRFEILKLFADKLNDLNELIL